MSAVVGVGVTVGPARLPTAPVPTHASRVLPPAADRAPEGARLAGLRESSPGAR